MRKVYIAGKYNDTSVVRCLNNIREGIIAAVQILKRGDIPFCPFLDCLFVLVGGAGDLTEQHFRDYSLEWLKACDEIYLLPSWTRSKGCKAELDMARDLGLVVTFVENEAKPTDLFCVSCGGDTAIRNPAGDCDHLYYPENIRRPS